MAGKCLSLVVAALFSSTALGLSQSIAVEFTTGPSDPANGLINASSTPVTFVNLGGLGFDLSIDAGETQDLAPLGPVQALAPTDGLVNFEFFVTGTSIPVAVSGVEFRVEDVEGIGEALTGFTYTDSDGMVHTPLFTDTATFTPDAGTIIDQGGSRFYHPASAPFIQLGKGIGINLTNVPAQAFSVSRAMVSGTGGVTIGPTLGNLTPVVPPPPVIIEASANPSILWPPNKKLVTVSVSASVEGGAGNTGWTVFAIQCNEPHGAGDLQFVDDHTVALRATRTGKGDGRIYTLWLRATDEAGNESEPVSVLATVPHGQWNKTK